MHRFCRKKVFSVTYAPREKILGRARSWSKQKSLCSAKIRFSYGKE